MRFQSTLPARGATPQDIKTTNIKADFNPRSPHGERHRHPHPRRYPQHHFNLRSPHGERHCIFLSYQSSMAISIHAPRTGSDRAQRWNRLVEIFQSTLPARGATDLLVAHAMNNGFQSTLPARGATATDDPDKQEEWLFQSTLPARGATQCTGSDAAGISISIHAPRTGSDRPRRRKLRDKAHFNPRSPHGERLVERIEKGERRYFNPRSPHGERHRVHHRLCVRHRFQSTLPARGATQVRRTRWNCQQNFNPRSPHGERRDITGERLVSEEFQSTLPARGATFAKAGIAQRYYISIHAPRTGSDGAAICMNMLGLTFQSTLPARGATAVVSHACGLGADFNPRSPHGERPNLFFEAIRIIKISIHAPRTGSDRGALPDVDRRPRISIHAPRTGSDP